MPLHLISVFICVPSMCSSILQVMLGRRETRVTRERTVLESKAAQEHQVHQVKLHSHRFKMGLQDVYIPFCEQWIWKLNTHHFMCKEIYTIIILLLWCRFSFYQNWMCFWKRHQSCKASGWASPPTAFDWLFRADFAVKDALWTLPVNKQSFCLHWELITTTHCVNHWSLTNMLTT